MKRFKLWLRSRGGAGLPLYARGGTWRRITGLWFADALVP